LIKFVILKIFKDKKFESNITYQISSRKIQGLWYMVS